MFTNNYIIQYWPFITLLLGLFHYPTLLHIALLDITLHEYTYIHKLLCTHTDIHTYIHTYIRTYVHTYIRTYVHTYIRTYVHTYIRTYVHTYIRTYIHTYMNTMNTHAYLPKTTSSRNFLLWFQSSAIGLVVG